MVVIKEADKGCTVAIMSKLRESTTYEDSETEDHHKRVTGLIKEYLDQNTPYIHSLSL